MPVVRRWTQLATAVAHTNEHLRVHRDQVIGPGGEAGPYHWFDAPDQVRVAAAVDGGLLFVEQDHYLIGTTLQLPGGTVEGDEGDRAAAARELREETGFHGGRWTSRGMVHPVPSLSPIRVHLWSASALRSGPAQLESNESDARVISLDPAEAARAARAGRITCAASVALVLALDRAA